MQLLNEVSFIRELNIFAHKKLIVDNGMRKKHYVSR
jgi:hypothetical protein